MKNNFRILVAAAALVVGSTSFAMGTRGEGVPTKEVTVSLNDVYVPGGFDSTTDAYVIANGMFPNGCYKWKGADVKSVDSFKHEIVSKAVVSQGMCLMVLVPFTKDIKLGKLESGVHSLRFMSGDGTYFEKTLSVE